MMPGGSDDSQQLYQEPSGPLYVHDLAWRLRGINRVFERVTGYTRDDTLGMSFLDLVAPEHHAAVIQSAKEQIGGAPPHDLDVHIVTREGSRIALQVTTEVVYEDGEAVGIRGFARDNKREGARAFIAELSSRIGQLEKLNSHLRRLHRLSTTPYTRLETLFASYLQAGREMLDLPCGAVWQSTADGVVIRATDGECGIVEDPGAAIVIADKGTVIHDGGDNVCACAMYVGTALFSDGRLFGGIGFWSMTKGNLDPHAREIVESMAQGISTALHHRYLSEQLAISTTHDPLTRVSNRLLFSRRLESALAGARDRGSMVAIFFIDVDRFKRINDSFGRAVGDAFLEQMGGRLKGHMRLGDTLARTGGDEFTAILPNTGEQSEVTGVAHRLLGALRTPCRIDGHELSATASIGISVYPRDGVDGGALLRNALAAMYAAERRGSDGVQLYSKEDTKTAVARLSIATSLKRALERNEFRLFFQPQVDLRGRLVGAEALLGWLHPELGRVPAHEFIPIAEDTGMILPIGNWVLREACRQAAEWLQRDIHPRIAVNVSAVQFAHAGFVDSVAAVLKETDLPPEFLELELTESLLVRDVQQVAESLGTLRRLGVRVAIDDFGTGYSSLRYIRDLPLDTLKIDRSFIMALGSGQASLELLRAIVALGHTLGLSVTAEGVETRSQLRLVRMAGCDLAQGHLFGAALETEAMEALLRNPQTVFAVGRARGKVRPQEKAEPRA